MLSSDTLSGQEMRTSSEGQLRMQLQELEQQLKERDATIRASWRCWQYICPVGEIPDFVLSFFINQHLDTHPT